MLLYPLIKIAVGSVILASTVFITSVQACEFSPPVRPSRETRIFENTDVGFSFQLPENYRAMGTHIQRNVPGQGILVLDPSGYAFMQCIIRNNVATEGALESASIEIVPIRSRQQDIYDLVIQAYPYMRNEGRNFRNSTFAGRQAITYSQLGVLYEDLTFNYTSLVSPDGKYLITISGPSDSSELDLLLSSFKFE